MHYTIQSIKYLLKNFIYLFPFVVLPAFFFALSIDEVALESVIRRVFAGDFSGLTFGEIFRSVSFLGFSSGWSLLSGTLGTVFLVIGASLLMAFTERHMRIGKRNYHGVFPRLNENFLPTLGVVLLLLFAYELFALILSALLFFFFQISNPVLAMIFCVVAYVGMHYVLLFVVTLGYLWLPCMMITGFGAFEALRYSYQLCHPIRGKIIFHQFLLLFIAEVLIIASVFIPGDVMIPVLVATVFYTYMMMLFCVRMQVVYFDRAQIERADLKTYYGK